MFVICPSENVIFSITGYDNNAIPGARIELVELSNGLFYYATTDISGNAQTNARFGNYSVRVYKNNVLISQENLQVFYNTLKQIRCTLYGIQLQVSVIDLFGSPIAGVTVALNGPAKAYASTQSNGIATFDNIIGGTCKSPLKPKVHQKPPKLSILMLMNLPLLYIKMEKYISVGGALILASSFLTVLVVIVIAVLFVLIEAIRCHRKTNNAALL